MAYEITEQDFCRVVKNPHCIGTETRNGAAKDGHPDCDHCKGNYFVGGECNFGGKHLMANDLRDINRNFRAFDALLSKQTQLTKSKSEKEFNKNKEKLITSFRDLKNKCEGDIKDFFYAACIGAADSQLQFTETIKTTFEKLAEGLSFYIAQVEETTWTQLQKFQVKIQQLNKLSKEAIKLNEDYKNETDPEKKQQLLVLLTAKNQELAKLRKELEEDPIFDLFTQEKNKELANIVQNIFRGNDTFFKWKKKKEDEEEQQQEKYLGFIPKKWGKKLLWAGIIIAILIFLYFIVRKMIGNNK